MEIQKIDLGPLPEEECLWGDANIFGYTAETMEYERFRCYVMGLMNREIIDNRKMIADSLRDLVSAIYRDCYGDCGCGDIGYEGQYEREIQSIAEAIVNIHVNYKQQD